MTSVHDDVLNVDTVAHTEITGAGETRAHIVVIS